MTTKEAAALVGSISKLARALGISRQAVYQWRGQVPRLRVYQIKELVSKRDGENH